MNLSLQKHLPASVTLDPYSTVAVFCLQPKMIKGWYQGQKRVLFTMWETSELPADMYEHFPQFDKILVPCAHNKDLFSQYHDNVSVCQLGIDTSFWRPCEVPKNDKFRFVAGGSSWQRKGLDLVVAAFQRLNLKDAELVVKITPEIRGEPPEISSPNIRLVESWLSLQQEYDLYATADCFVAASRGEGFGLMPLQTIAMGIPTVMTDMTGHKEFAHLASTLVDAPPKPAVHGRVWNVGNWYEADVDDLAQAMLDQYNNREQNRKTAIARASEVSAFTWNKSAQKMVRLAGVGGTLTERVWVPADQAKVQITPIRKVEADIGRHRVRIAKGETVMVPIVVRDTLRDAGYLGDRNGK
jgi:glycosyltransferase involved in cell wall biosynthesis